MSPRAPKRIGLLGGTFNPIHTGHLLLAERAREQCALDRVLFIPTATPPHKAAKDLAPARVRLELVRRAVAGNPAFAASDIELRRGGVSYTVDTIRALRAAHPGTRFYLIVGQDMLAVRWRGWDEIRRLATLVVAGRPGARRAGSGRIVRLEMPQVDIASSDIRARVKAGHSIRYLVPAPVERAIQKRRLYR